MSAPEQRAANERTGAARRAHTSENMYIRACTVQIEQQSIKSLLQYFQHPLHAARRAMAAAEPLPKTAVVAFTYNRFPGDRPALPVIVVPPTTSKERQKKRPLAPRRRNSSINEKTRERYILGWPWSTLLSTRVLPPILRGGSSHFYASYCVVHKNSKTAPAALTSNKSLTDGVRGCSHSHASPTSFQILRLCSVHDAHRVNRWCLDCGSPLIHHQHLAVSVFPNRFRCVPVAACPDRS